eukprot:TRINITY_DN14608_c0_g1_i1.p1 TRINITY_DN14608_c0_g1~~TRINITY_DN14608_c0_g1_i1.p1  ORF type:complete len:414 (+),score=53.94 TRINITY_DN14608_c0_g1_i1:131-1372(+)
MDSFPCLLCAFVTVAFGLVAPPNVVVDLSKPPQSRWEGAVEKILERHPYEYSFEPVFKSHAPLFDAISAAQRTRISSAVSRHYPDTIAELECISRQFAAIGHGEVNLEYLTLWLYFHELAHTELKEEAKISTRECTGVVAQSEADVMFHGGNMDQSPPATRNLTLRVKFIDEVGNTVFQGVDWYTILSTGVSRAVKKGVATVQENWRTTKMRSVDDVIADIEVGVISQMLVFRSLFTTAHKKSMTFAEFVGAVTSIRLAAPFYVVVSGPDTGDGVVIARNLTGSDGTSRFAVLKDRSAPDDFFLVQANSDRWLPDDPNDPRRTAAERTLRGIGHVEGASLLGLFAATSTYPVHNPHTAYTAIMSASTGELHAYVREALCPVDPYASVVQDTRYCQSSSRGLAMSPQKEIIVRV